MFQFAKYAGIFSTFYSVNETNTSSNGCFFEVQGSMKLRISIKAIDSR